MKVLSLVLFFNYEVYKFGSGFYGYYNFYLVFFCMCGSIDEKF